MSAPMNIVTVRRKLQTWIFLEMRCIP